MISAGEKRDQMGFRNLPGLPGPHAKEKRSKKSRKNRHFDTANKERFNEQCLTDEDEQNSMVTSSSSTFSPSNTKSDSWDDQGGIEMYQNDTEEPSETDELEAETEIRNVQPNSTINECQERIDSSSEMSQDG